MEPQINYSGSSFQDQNSYGQQKIYGRSRFGGKGCFGYVGAAIFLIIIIIASIYFVYPALTPNTIHGDFIDMTIVPDKDGSQKLWIVTDGSFSFIQTTKSPGSYSSGVKCYACKTWTYVYDPISEKVIKKIKTEQQDVILHVDLVYSKGKVWEINDGYNENEPKIMVYDAITNEVVMDTKALTSKNPDLSAGLTGLTYTEKEKTITFKTKDGRNQIIYSIEGEKFYPNSTDYAAAKRKDSTITTIAVLSPEKNSTERKRLFKGTGPKAKLEDKRSTLEHFEIETYKSSLEGLNIEPLTNMIFIEGIVYYCDNDCAIIIHLDQTGRKSNRMMTCVDLKSGQQKWTVPQEDLLKRMKIDKDKDTFSDLFFTKDKIKVRRSGNLVVLEMKGEGMIGFDLETGKKLWQMDI